MNAQSPLWPMTNGHSSGLPPEEAPVMIADKRKLFFFFSLLFFNAHCECMCDAVPECWLPLLR